jgi:hypothetical protein
MVLPHLLPAIALENYVPDRSENAIAKILDCVEFVLEPVRMSGSGASRDSAALEAEA